MDALKDFEYKHNEKITLTCSIGTIELTFKTQDGVKKDNAAWEEMMGQVFEDLPYSDPAMNEKSFFVANLIENNKIMRSATSALAEEAIKDLYCQVARAKMEDEFYPKPWNY
jgi:hypothetical protein